MKVNFDGTPQQIRKEMLQWLNDNQTDTDMKDKVVHKLSQYNIRLTDNINDKLPQSKIKQLCQLEGQEWFVFLDQLQQLGVKKKRTPNTRVLTNLKIVEECKLVDNDLHS